MLPALNLDREVTYVQARYLDPVEGRPKYANAAGRLAANPRLGWIQPATVNDRHHLIVCEGTVDALSIASTGTAAVAVLGATYVDQRTAREIARGAAKRHVMLALDGDPAGRNAGSILAASLTSAGCSNRVLSLPDGHDINSMLGNDRCWLTRQLEPTPPHRSVSHHGLTRTLR
ncbi:MAG: toprim domain-containing protein [Ilumatobacteraceae bacterium]